MATGKYTEIEFCIMATGEAEVDATYEFRLTKAAWVPTFIGGCKLWLRSDLAWQDAAKTVPCTDSSLIWTGEDKSGSVNDVVQATEAARLVYLINQINSIYPVWRLDGSDDCMARVGLTGGAIAQPTTFFLVVKIISTTANATLFDVRNGYAGGDRQALYRYSDGNMYTYAGSQVSLGAVGNGTWFTIIMQYNGASSIFRINGSEQIINPGANGFDGITIGADYTGIAQFANMDLADFALYGDVSGTDILLLENYAKTRYAHY